MSFLPDQPASLPERIFALEDEGTGRPVLVLHGGGGPATVATLAGTLGTEHRVLTPTHPGFGGTPRPPGLASIASLADLYVELLTRLDLDDVLVVGSSIGGWIGCEIALRASERVAGLVLIDAVGIAVPGEVVTDVFSLSPPEMMQLSFHEPVSIQAASPPPTAEQQTARTANFAALRAYTEGGRMEDPALRARLAGISALTLVIWGGSDGIVRPSYGRAYADAIPSARFEIVDRAGHLPQLEQPAAVLALIKRFALGLPQRPRVSTTTSTRGEPRPAGPPIR